MNRETRRANGIRGPIEYPPGAFPNADQVRAAQQQQQQGPVFNVGPLMLGDQLVALTAASCPGPAAQAVDRAMEIVAHSLARVATGELDRRVKALVTDIQKAAKPEPEELTA